MQDFHHLPTGQIYHGGGSSQSFVEHSHWGMLTGAEIIRQINLGNIVIKPFDAKQINPNSYNLKMGNKIKMYKRQLNKYALDPKIDNEMEEHEIDLDKGFLMIPNTLYIGNTMEYTESHGLIPMINGRSSGGRLGINIHACAGFGDLGFCGTWTLELFCIEPVIIYPGMEIAQISWFTPAGDPSYKYNGRYQGQIDPVGSRIQKEKTEESLWGGKNK